MNESGAFLIFYDFKDQFELLTDRQLGKVMKLIMQHVNGAEPELESCETVVKITYSFLCGSIDRGREKMETVKKNRSEAAKKREEQKKAEALTKKKAVAETAQTEIKTKTEIKTETEAGEKTETIAFAALPPENESPSLSDNNVKKIPDMNEVAEYCKERRSSVDPKRFYEYYSANGWRHGGDEIADWKALVRLWETRERDKKQPAPDDRVQAAISEKERQAYEKYSRLNWIS